MSIVSSKIDVSSVISRTPWFSKGLQREHLDVPISHITFLAHPVPNSEAHLSDPTNHWTALLHLILNHDDDNDISGTRTGSAAVHLEVSPTMGGGQPGTIIVKSILDHDLDGMNHRVEATVIVPPGQLKTTVSDVLELIIDLKRDHYIFSPVGEGCRFWLYTFVGDLASAGIVSHEDAEKVRVDLRLHWPSGSKLAEGQPHPREISRGSFPKSAAT